MNDLFSTFLLTNLHDHLWIHGLDPVVHGIYEGWIPVTISEAENQWIIDVPIKYERLKAETTCTLNAEGNVSISGLYYPAGESAEGTIKLSSSSTASSELTLSGGFLSTCADSRNPCPTFATGQTGWMRFQTDSPTWSVSISPTSISPGALARGTAVDWTWIIGYYGAMG